MSMTKVTRLDEGPLDFIRGASAETGRKVANSSVGRAVGDVVQAGKQASAAGEFEKSVAMFAQLLTQYDKIKKMVNIKDSEQQQEPQQPQGRQEPQMNPAPQPAAKQSASPEAFRTTQKPKGRMGQHGFEYTFNSYLQATHGERIDEGVWDFVRGAGSAVAGKMRDKITSYGERPSMLKDIYMAGKSASNAADQNALRQKLQTIEKQTKEALRQLVVQLRSFGPNAPDIMGAAVRRLPPETQQRVYNLLAKNVRAA